MRTKEWKGLAALLLSALAASPAGAGENGYAYSYFKEQRPLTLDTTRVAVLLAPDRKAPEPDLARYGLDASTATPMAVQGWSLVGTTASIRMDAAIERAVRQIAEGEPVEFVSPVFLDDQGEPVIVTADILVGFDRTLDPSRAEAILTGSGAGSILDRDWAGMKRTYRLRSVSRNGFTVLEAANALARRPEVTFAEPDMMVTGRTELIPNDPYFPYLWGLHNDGTFPISCTAVADFDMDGPEAWDVTIGDPSILVAVLDSGIQLNHPDLNLYTFGFDATGQAGGGGPVNACDNHGTWVAGCLSGIINNNLGIVGVAPGVKSASARIVVLNLPCDGTGVISASWVVDALAWAESIGARITNSSWYRNTPSSAIDQKFADTRAAGILHFAAAGNNASSTLVYPASLPSINAVAALEPCGQRAPFSNFGVGLDFSAPGYVLSTDRTGADGGNDGVNDGLCLPAGILGCDSDADCPAGSACVLVTRDYAWVAGTSFASPYAAGVAALLLSLHPSLTADHLAYALKKSAMDLGTAGYDTSYGWGFVNAANILQPESLVTPGEGADLQVTSFDPITGNLSFAYTAACASGSHDIYFGPLSQVSTYGWSGSVCGIGNTGTYTGFNPGAGSFFFVVVGSAYDVEGSYGTGSPGERPPASGVASCGRTQLLASACP